MIHRFACGGCQRVSAAQHQNPLIWVSSPNDPSLKTCAGRVCTHVVFKIFLTGLEGVLAQLHADLGGGIVYEVPVSAEDIIAAPSSALLIGIPIGALLLLRLGRGRRWRRPQLGDGGNVLRDRMVERR